MFLNHMLQFGMFCAIFDRYQVFKVSTKTEEERNSIYSIAEEVKVINKLISWRRTRIIVEIIIYIRRFGN